MKRNFPTITPGLLYHNATEMIEWLCLAFRFENKLVISGNNREILHAHLVFHNGGIMISSAEHFEYPDLYKSPKQTGASTVEIVANNQMNNNQRTANIRFVQLRILEKRHILSFK